MNKQEVKNLLLMGLTLLVVVFSVVVVVVVVFSVVDMGSRFWCC